MFHTTSANANKFSLNNGNAYNKSRFITIVDTVGLQIERDKDRQTSSLTWRKQDDTQNRSSFGCR